MPSCRPWAWSMITRRGAFGISRYVEHRGAIAMITVHHLQASQSEGVVWLFEERGLPYELKIYQRTPEMAAPPAYKALHPQGTAPIVTDGAWALAETGAIFEYVLRRFAD